MQSTSTEVTTQVNLTQGEYEEENEVTRLIYEFCTITGFYDNTTNTEFILDNIVFQIHNNTITPPSKKCFSNFLKQLTTTEQRVKYSVKAIVTDFSMQYLSNFLKVTLRLLATWNFWQTRHHKFFHSHFRYYQYTVSFFKS